MLVASLGLAPAGPAVLLLQTENFISAPPLPRFAIRAEVTTSKSQGTATSRLVMKPIGDTPDDWTAIYEITVEENLGIGMDAYLKRLGEDYASWCGTDLALYEILRREYHPARDEEILLVALPCASYISNPAFGEVMTSAIHRIGDSYASMTQMWGGARFQANGYMTWPIPEFGLQDMKVIFNRHYFGRKLPGDDL